jgi:hypothetical protein
MKISKRGEYALRALIHIGIAHKNGRDIIHIGEISKHETIPLKFLEHILDQVKETGYLGSKRASMADIFSGCQWVGFVWGLSSASWKARLRQSHVPAAGHTKNVCARMERTAACVS